VTDASRVRTEHDRAGNVGIVSFARGRDNFFDIALLEALADGMDRLVRDGARCLVLRSDARHFCAGIDFGTSRPSEGARHIYDVAPRLFGQPVPVVAAINGAAIGGGLGLALTADFRVTTPESRFAANFARIGISQGFALTLTLPAVIGPQRATELLYTGRRLSGAEAVEIGLCDRLVAVEKVDDAALDLAREIAASAPLAVREIRTTLRGELVSAVDAVLTRERRLQDQLMTTADFREGIRAARERRPAQFVCA
jgi:enoyl-CoA hydratase/carnithine racemase